MIRKATIKDLPQIMDIINEIVKEMQIIQNYQWNSTYPTSSVFLNDIKNENLYVYQDISNEIIGLICVDCHQPNEYKNLNWSLSNEAIVIHRMAVNTNFRGKNIGRTLMNHAEKLARKSNISILKTDTYSTNINMNALIKKLEYSFVGEINIMERPHPFYCYEKILTT